MVTFILDRSIDLSNPDDLFRDCDRFDDQYNLQVILTKGGKIHWFKTKPTVTKFTIRCLMSKNNSNFLPMKTLIIVGSN